MVYECIDLVIKCAVHPQFIWDQDEFFSSSGLEKCVTEAVNGCRQNESQWMQMLTDGLECCDVFIRLSFWRHPFTAEHLLTLILTAPIHCRASIAETFLQTWWRNNLIYTTSQKFLNSKIYYVV